MPIRIGIVDDHEIVREGLKVFLETDEDFAFVGEASTPDEVTALCDQNQPNVLLFDYLDGYDCLDLLKRLRQRHPHMRVLILTTNLHIPTVVEVVRMGVHGYLFKQLDIDELAQAIRTVHAGSRMFDREVEEIMAVHLPRPSSFFLNLVGLLALGLSVLPMGHAHPAL